MRKWLILLSAFSATAVNGAPAWTWTDASGTVHFSDRPVEGARRVELSGAQGFGSAGAVRSAPRTTASDEQAGSLYQAIDIVSPADQETLWNVGGVLNVQVRFQPALQAGHRFDLAFDGQRRNVNTTTTRVALPDIVRGSHTLQVVVIDAAGAEVTRSAPRTFFVQQTSVLNPNSANGRARAGAN
ncbi:MAG TPA: DUF4124 domain-containing protein [Gammaproteobacteria bacterium]|nr:DUF4124 domain-containing protein [Gammaproteobacteria bacterium]